MPGFGSLAPDAMTDEDYAAMSPETFVNPAVKKLIGGVAQHIGTPGAVMAPNPYPEGSEAADWYEDQRKNAMLGFAGQRGMAALMPLGAAQTARGAVLGAGAIRRPRIAVPPRAGAPAEDIGVAEGGIPAAETPPSEAPAPVQAPIRESLARKASRAAAAAPDVAAPTILPRQSPTPEDIAAIKAAAVQYGRKGWPTTEKEVFSTTPEAYAETTRLVPQVSNKELLPGPLPGEKLPLEQRAAPIVENVDPISERIAERLDPLVRQQSPLLKFYHTGPVIRGLERYGEMTTPEANFFMRDWSGQGAATSPRTQTPPNLRNASYLLYQRAAGNPLTPERFEREGNVPGFPMMGMHVDLANKFATATENPWINPKPFTFRENWAGNLRDVTGDTHNIRSTLYEMDQAKPGSLPRGWFTSDDAYAKYRKAGFQALDPGDIHDRLGSVTAKGMKRQSEYLPMTEPWYRAAQRLGIHPAEAQSGGWFSYGGITGLQSPPKTIANLLNDQVAATAKALNVSPEKVVNWWSRGKIPLAGIAGAATLGPSAFGSLVPPSQQEQ